MPTREDMNSVGRPFLALRREPNKAVTPDAWLHAEQDMRIAELEAALLSKARRITELETVASEWQAVAEDKQIQLDAARRRIGELERDAKHVLGLLDKSAANVRELTRINQDLRQANKDFAAAAIKPDEPMTAAEVRAGQAVATLRPASTMHEMAEAVVRQQVKLIPANAPALLDHCQRMSEAANKLLLRETGIGEAVEMGRAWDGLLEVVADEPTSPPEPVFNVLLFEPVAAPAVPNAMIGRLKVSADMWDRISGVGRYAGHGAMDVFGATHCRPLSVWDYPSCDAVPLVKGVHAITCRRIPIRNGDRDTYQWRAVVESADDRELVRRLGGEWWA